MHAWEEHGATTHGSLRCQGLEQIQGERITRTSLALLDHWDRSALRLALLWILWILAINAMPKLEGGTPCGVPLGPVPVHACTQRMCVTGACMHDPLITPRGPHAAGRRPAPALAAAPATRASPPTSCPWMAGSACRCSSSRRTTTTPYRQCCQLQAEAAGIIML